MSAIVLNHFGVTLEVARGAIMVNRPQPKPASTGPQQARVWTVTTTTTPSYGDTACHGDTATGGTPAPSLTVEQQLRYDLIKVALVRDQSLTELIRLSGNVGYMAKIILEGKADYAEFFPPAKQSK